VDGPGNTRGVLINNAIKWEHAIDPESKDRQLPRSLLVLHLASW
jgi:hypothetical protein